VILAAFGTLIGRVSHGTVIDCIAIPTGLAIMRRVLLSWSEAIRSVLRLLIVVLLWIVPLQMSYAAASSYCSSSEQGSVASHFGHHVHKHLPSGGADNNAGKLGIDLDCGFCHLAGGHIVVGVPAQTTAMQQPRLNPPPIERFRSVVVSQHNRPPLVAPAA
jgi:hypothetical protein